MRHRRSHTCLSSDTGRALFERARGTMLAGHAFIRDPEAGRFVADVEQLFESIISCAETVNP